MARASLPTSDYAAQADRQWEETIAFGEGGAIAGKGLVQFPQTGIVETVGVVGIEKHARHTGWRQAQSKVKAFEGAGGESVAGPWADFRDESVLRRLEELLNGAKPDLVLSDMAPNMSGVGEVDQARAMHLAELAQEFAAAHLKPGGAFLTKLFQGRGFDEYVKNLRAGYDRVSMRKPKASRARSAEAYALALRKRVV